MKNLTTKCLITLALGLMGFVGVNAQNGSESITAHSDAASGLDLFAVAELFKDSENLEKFEHNLNSSEKGINNIDLNGNGEIDFIRVTEKVVDQTHLIILQVPLSNDDFQDVATIAIEQENGKNYNLHVQGDPVIYGENYYVVPANNDFSAWNVVRWLFSPNYRPYYSPYGYTTLPRWWGIRRPIAYNIYHARIGNFAGKNFITSRTVRVKTVAKVNYHPRTSTLVVKKVSVGHAPIAPIRPTKVVGTTVTKTTTKVVKPRKKP